MMPKHSRTKIAALVMVGGAAALPLVSPAPARANPLFTLLGIGGARQVYQGIRLNDRRRRDVILQTREVTCGPAAVAALLRFSFGEETTEGEIARLSGTFEAGTSTLLRLRDACRSKGYEAVGYRMTLPQLVHAVEASDVPVLIHFKTPDLHYALFLGQVGDTILLSDPSLGNVSLDRGDFLRRWSGNALVVRSASRAANRAPVENRRRSAEARLQTLNRASALIGPRF